MGTKKHDGDNAPHPIESDGDGQVLLRAQDSNEDIHELRKYIVKMMHSEMELMENIKQNEESIATVNDRISKLKELIETEQRRGKNVEQLLQSLFHELKGLMDKKIVVEARYRQYCESIMQCDADSLDLKNGYQHVRRGISNLDIRTNASHAAIDATISLAHDFREQQSLIVEKMLDFAQLDAHRADLQKIRAKKRYIDQHSEQIELEERQLHVTHEKAREELASASEELSRLDTIIEGLNVDCSRQRSRLLGEVRQLRTQKDQSNKKLGIKQRKYRVKMKGEISTLKKRVTFVTRELEGHEMCVEDILSSLAPVRDERDRSESRITSLEAEVAELQKSISAVREKIDGFDALKEALDLGAMKAELHSKNTEVDQAVRGLSALKDERARLEEEAHSLCEEVKRLDGQMALSSTTQIEEELAQANDELESLEDQRNSLQEQIRELEDACSRVTADTQKHRQRLKRQKGSTNKSRKELRKMSLQQEQAAAKLEKTHKDLGVVIDAEQLANSLETALDEAKTAHKSQLLSLDNELLEAESEWNRRCLEEEERLQAELQEWNKKVASQEAIMMEADAVPSPVALRNKMELQEAPHPDEHEDASVYLRVTWVFTALRRPHWRLATCSLRILCFLFASATSPLLASVQSPGHFPVYCDFIGVLLTHLSAWKLLVHGVLIGLIALWVRFVVYPLWFQDQWNWRQQYKHARHTFRRLSRVASAREMKEMMQQQNHTAQQRHARQPDKTSEAIQLRIFQSTTSDTASSSVRVHTEPRAQGSWTLVIALLPVTWWTVVWLLRCIVQDTDYDALLFGQDTAHPQWQVQLTVYQTVMTLSTICWLLTLDKMLQDLAPRTNAMLRVTVDWLLLLLLGVGGVYFRGFSQLFTVILATWAQQASYSPWLFATTLTSESWRCMVSGFVVVLDLLWLVQDRQFPSFATQVGTTIYGLHNRDFISMSTRFRGIGSVVFTSKWIHTSLVVALLLPLDLCGFFQDYTYNPQDYSQVVGVASGYRVFPSPPSINSTVNIPHEIEALLTKGSIGRYYLQSSALDRVPSLVCVAMMAGLFVWLHKREQWKLCYAALLGEPTRADQAKATHDLNAALPQPTRVVLKQQLRLHSLYRVRSQLDLLGAWLAVVSVGIVVLQVRSIWHSAKSSALDAAQEMAGETFGLLLSVVSLAMVYQLYHRYAIKYEMLVLRKQIPPTPSKRWWQGTSKSLLLYPFLLEVSMSAFCLPPFAHGELRFDEERYLVISNQIANSKKCPPRMVSTSAQSCALQYAYPMEVLNLVVFVRLYWLLRLLRNALFHKLFSDHAALWVINSSSSSSSSARPTNGMLPQEISSLRWSFRMCVALLPGRVVAGLFVVLWMGTSAAVSILERPFPSPLDDEVHSLWLTIVTISAVGYGDAYPVTAFGRLAIILGAVLGGAVVVSLMTSIFLETLKGSTEEHHFVQQLELLTYNKKLQQQGASLIAAVWKAHQRRKRECKRREQNQEQDQEQDQDSDVLQRAHAFKITRKFHGPKETFESLEQSRIRSIAHWRTTQMSKLVETSSRQRRDAVDSLEQDVAELEISLAALLVR